MRGASADSLATLTDALRDAVDGGADAFRVASDLFAVADVLRREPGLRRVAPSEPVTHPRAGRDAQRERHHVQHRRKVAGDLGGWPPAPCPVAR